MMIGHCKVGIEQVAMVLGAMATFLQHRPRSRLT